MNSRLGKDSKDRGRGLFQCYATDVHTRSSPKILFNVCYASFSYETGHFITPESQRRTSFCVLGEQLNTVNSRFKGFRI